MTKFDTSIYILQIAVTVDESFEVTLTCFCDAKIIKGYNKSTLFINGLRTPFKFLLFFNVLKARKSKKSLMRAYYFAVAVLKCAKCAADEDWLRHCILLKTRL